MFSIQGDMILDPFLGTGTTTIAAAISARNSIGYEIDKNFAEIIERRIQEVPSLSQKIINQRLKSHKEFADQWIKSGKEFKYRSKNYDFGVISRSEEHINFPIARNVLKSTERKFRISYD
jgi:tRNA/tmRNA/rRNA uracil-C5-methylase (TrmA/RlmC/RlmD family)